MRRDAVSTPGRGGEELGTLRVSGAQAGLPGQARPPPPPVSFGFVRYLRCTHARTSSRLPACTHMHTRTHTWPPDPEVPGTPRPPGSSGPACARLPSHGRCLLRLHGVPGRRARDHWSPGLQEGRETARGCGRPGRRGGAALSRLCLPNQIFVLYFPSRGALFAEGGVTQRLRDWFVRHHCPSVPCVLCQAPPRPPPPASPSPVPGRCPPGSATSWPGLLCRPGGRSCDRIPMSPCCAAWPPARTACSRRPRVSPA